MKLSVRRNASQREIVTTPVGDRHVTEHVEGVFARNQILFEPREISTADDVTVRYHTWLHAQTSLDDLNLQLMTEGAGVKSVIWEHPKQRDLA